MQVQEIIRHFHQWAEGTCACQLSAFLRAIQYIRRPQPVHVFINKARQIGVCRIKARKRGDIGEGQNEAAPVGRKGRRQELIERHRAAQFIAVDQGTDQNGRTRRIAHHGGRVRNIQIAVFMARDVRNLDQLGTSDAKA